MATNSLEAGNQPDVAMNSGKVGKVKVKTRMRKPPRARQVQPSRHFHSLASRVLALREGAERHKTIGVASCIHNQGNSAVASNLAVAICQAISGEVLLVDCVEPIRRAQGPGWVEFVAGNVDWVDVVRPSDTPKLSVMSYGVPLELSHATYNRNRLENACQSVKEHFEFVIFDLPCADDLAGCLPIASVLDGVILNLKAGKVNSARAVAFQKELQTQGANIVGAVLNQTLSHASGFLQMLFGSNRS